MTKIEGIQTMCIDGQIGPVTFSITGPQSVVKAIVKYIRNLDKMHGGPY